MIAGHAVHHPLCQPPPEGLPVGRPPQRRRALEAGVPPRHLLRDEVQVVGAGLHRHGHPCVGLGKLVSLFGGLPLWRWFLRSVSVGMLDSGERRTRVANYEGVVRVGPHEMGQEGGRPL